MMGHISLIAAVTTIIVMVILTGCDGKKPANMQDRGVTHSSEVKRPKAVPTHKHQKSKLCVGLCAGPRIDLRSGKLKIGPGFGIGLGL